MNAKMSAEEARAASRHKGKAFCKVCFDAGKTEAECTSHYLKSAPGPDGKLVCPTLLNQSCRTCGQKGHTSSYCNGGRPSPATSAPTKRTQPQPQPQPQPSSYNPRGNSFGALFKQEEEEVERDANKPLTMAERLKCQALKCQALKCQALNRQTMSMPALAPAPPPPLSKPQIAELPPKSQFWWQDEDD